MLANPEPSQSQTLKPIRNMCIYAALPKDLLCCNFAIDYRLLTPAIISFSISVLLRLPTPDHTKYKVNKKNKKVKNYL